MKPSTLAALVALFLPVTATAQEASPWTVVRFPTDAPFTVNLVSTNPDACGKCDEAVGPSGRATITRDDQHTTIEIKIRGLPSGPAKYYLYAIDENGHAANLAAFKETYEGTQELPADRYEALMLIVSTQANLSALPQRRRVVLYSSVPSGLRAVRRPSQPQ